MVPFRKPSSVWAGFLAPNPAKRWTELFFLAYSPVWITWVLCILGLSEWGYMSIGVTAAAPVVLAPIFLQPKAEREKPWHQRYWVKANAWVAIFGFVGNYLWTHYFYQVLGAAYTFKAHELNQVPITLYFMTHAYFALYHALANVLIRKARNVAKPWGPRAQLAAEIFVVFSLSYSTAFMETLTIAHFPYYTHKNKAQMYTDKPYTLWRAIVDALAASMLVTLLLDFWRLLAPTLEGASNEGLPWLAGVGASPETKL
ncbi:hypothetical protein QBZ16_004861 [Prototheca wickerhamii]|uniref:Cycloeucalenol cycloisomerase n=1 Tax=Prototheca wickerhamii TaxID=3111 RepID=A0AAD9IJB6_PROWI|nr:hypothetical protein QBZ16_004861 [Prototheca wickerhamii]